MPAKRKPYLIRILYSKKIFILALFFILITSYAFFKEMRRYQNVSTDLTKLESELSSLQARHVELLELVDYFKSEAFIESEARDKLGLRKEGEQVAVITDMNATSSLESLWGKEVTNKNDNLSNPQKWWRYFFAVK